MLTERRPILVLGALVLSMTVAAGVLRILEPGAVPPLGGVTLLSIESDAAERPEDKLFDVAVPERPWRAIVVHDSRTAAGSYDAIDKAHRRAGKDGCGYHLVVNNGTGGQDGRTEVGYRWKYQEPGDYLVGPNAGWYHQQAIGVCVVGDADQGAFTPSQQRELIWLVRQLQQEFSIPAEYVFVDVGAGDGPAPGFSEGRFRQSLLGNRSQTTALR